MFIRADASGFEAVNSLGVVPIGQWGHVLVRVENKVPDFYINGTITDKYGDTIFTKTPTGNISPVLIGMSFDGLMDDVRIYNRALSANEIRELYLGGKGNKAFDPSPANGATSVDPNVVLCWSEGYDALSHDVYLGTSYNNVNYATPASNEYMGNYDVNRYDPCGLELETIYFWRVDEVGASTTYKGKVWSFTTSKYGEPNFSLVGHWKFDEGEGSIAYDSVGENHGTIYGATWTTGQINGALFFDVYEGHYVLIGDNEAYDFGSNTDFSICAWLKTDGLAHRIRVLGKYGSGNDPGKGFQLNIEDPVQPQIGISDGINRVYSLATTNINDDGWHFIATVADRDENLEIYVDSVLEDFDPISSIGNINVDAPLVVGRNMDNPGQHFYGAIDDVRIYNRALSANEIQELYQGGLLGGP